MLRAFSSGKKNTFLLLLIVYILSHLVFRICISDSLEKDESELILQFQEGFKLGYGAQPPLYNWLQFSFFNIFGLNVFSLVFLKNSLLFTIYYFLFKASSIVLENDYYAIFSSISLMLIYNFSWVMHKDLTHSVLLMALCSVSLYLFFKVFTENSKKYYILFGVFLGLGILSKYNYLLFALSLLISGVMIKNIRRRIFNKNALLILLFFLLVVSPHIFWCLGNTNSLFSDLGDFKIGDSPISMIEATQANQAAHLYLRTPTAIWQLEADSGGIDEGFRIDESTTSMGDSGTTRFVIRNGGRVGIGTRNPRARLDVDGGIRVGQVDATGSGAGNCAASGCSADNAGTLRYCNNKIQFCKGSTSSWEQTGGGGLLGAFAWLQINITDATKVGDITMDMTNIQADGKPAIVGPVKNAEIGSAVVEGDFVSGKYILAAIGRSKISYAHTPPVNQIIAQNIYVSRNSTGRLRVWTTDHPSITGGGTQFITVMAFQRR